VLPSASAWTDATLAASPSVTTEFRHSPALDVEARSPWGVASVALVAGLLQIVASIVLGLAKLDHFLAAAGESPKIYMILAALLAAGAVSVWLVRERTAVAAALVFAWPAALYYGLRGRVSGLGLAYHGEFILHHFAAFLCLTLAIGVPLGWARDARLGRFRGLPLLFAVPGALALAASHLGQVPIGPAWLASPTLAQIGAGLLLLTWPCATALFWQQMRPNQRRPLALVLLVPVLVRLGFAGPAGLSGALVQDAGIVAIGAAIVVTAIATLVLLRPRIEPWVMVVVGLLCLLGSAVFYFLYEQGFGEFEDGLSGLLQSLFGFQVPYPSYVDDVRSAALMMGLFFMFTTVYAALVSTEDRTRGIALALLLVAGLGFSSPHLVLMLGAGALLVIEGLLPGAPHRELEVGFDLARFEAEIERVTGTPPGSDHDQQAAIGAAVFACVEGLAERLGLEPPTRVETGPEGLVISLRGELDAGAPLDLRARIDASAARLELVVGLPGRGEPLFELIPDPGNRGQRPTHLLARSHRVLGDLRKLEDFGDAPLDALTSFPSAYLRAWDGGIAIELGRELHGLRVDNLEALVRALARVPR
jgi:hypothetical protein